VVTGEKSTEAKEQGRADHKATAWSVTHLYGIRVNLSVMTVDRAELKAALGVLRQCKLLTAFLDDYLGTSTCRLLLDVMLALEY
jgi:hypothetical protein